ncbi:MAG: isopentenyl phosphate kinase [Microgenomates group bacterium]
MKKIIFVKLGGSLITDKEKPYTAKIEVIKNLTQQIASALKENPSLKLVIGNGGGSFPHYPAVKYKMTEGIKNEEQKMGFCQVQDAAAKLNRLIVNEFLNLNVKAISVNPSSIIITKRGKIKTFFAEPIIKFLKLGLTPVIYGDIVYDEVLGAKIISTEQLLTNLAIIFKEKGLGVDQVIHNGTTKGVLDNKGNLIPFITKKNFQQIKSFFTKVKGFDVTGGMIHKVEEAIILADYGIKTIIINGNAKKNLLKDALLGLKVEGTAIS